MNQQAKYQNTTLPILKYGDTILRQKVKDITDFSNLRIFIDQMFGTMYEEGGVGLAANQVGKSINLMVLDLGNLKDKSKTSDPQVFINSQIVNMEGSSIVEEGCLSIPDIRAEIKRPEIITLRYQDENKNQYENIYSGFISRVLQHEMDHLKGKLFIDYLTPAKRMLIKKRLLEISKSGQPSTGIIL